MVHYHNWKLLTASFLFASIAFTFIAREVWNISRNDYYDFGDVNNDLFGDEISLRCNNDFFRKCDLALRLSDMFGRISGEPRILLYNASGFFEVRDYNNDGNLDIVFDNSSIAKPQALFNWGYFVLYNYGNAKFTDRLMYYKTREFELGKQK